MHQGGCGMPMTFIRETLSSKGEKIEAKFILGTRGKKELS
jgi:hypothetical protein